MNVEHATERGPLSWMLECERCEKAFVSPIRGPRRGQPCPACGGDVITLGAGYPTRDADGVIVAMDPVSMLSREVAEAVTEGVFDEGPLRATLSGVEARRLRREQRRGIITIGAKPLPKAKKRSGKSPTRKVVPVARSWRARDERMLTKPREPITLGGDPLDVVREMYPDIRVNPDAIDGELRRLPEFNRLAGVRRLPLKWEDK